MRIGAGTVKSVKKSDGSKQLDNRGDTTLEFYSEKEVPSEVETQDFIFKARWSFRDNKNNDQYVIRLFFYLIIEKNDVSKLGKRLKNENLKDSWKIIEIKAEKI